ncbi:hypothetical protein [Amycolatopsis alkalitolerans]|uniref:hypothetical protein n=1 Tax=Amycolatopsis alkalitolerans TaxID=2547244 RepID=UPI001F27C29C|nr:hypothetical protein [Amycolatopsis alkalitolerans]
MHADELGGLAMLAAAVGPDTEPVPDVRALERAATAGPWVLTTLVTVAGAASLRAAATAGGARAAAAAPAPVSLCENSKLVCQIH